jgi:hypothetical protein
MNIFKDFIRILKLKFHHNQHSKYGSAEEDDTNYANNMIQQALNMCSNTVQTSTPIEQQTNEVKSPVQQVIQQVEPVKSEPKYFNDDGIQYKLEDGKMFKQTWKPVPDEQIDSLGNIFYSNYRIINKDTGKQVKSSKYIIEHLDWHPLDLQ